MHDRIRNAMLRSLSIRDFVIVDRLELEFSPGFTALTGETGAGKSILIDALALALGERGDAVVVREGAERTDIVAEFDIGAVTDLRDWLRAGELAEEDGRCLVRRVIDRSGRSRGFINGHAVTLAQLREAGEWLLDIHGQHQHQSLLRSASQRQLLDAYGGLDERAVRVAEAFGEWQRRREQRLGFEADAAAFAAEREELQARARDLEALNLTVEELQLLTAEHARLAHAASLIESAQQGLEALSEGEGASLSQVNGVIARLRSLVEHDTRLKDILDVLEPAQIQLQEAVYALRHYGERLETDPGRLREVERRIEAVHATARKYRVPPEALPDLLARTGARLAELGEVSDPGALLAAEERAHAECLAEAKELGAMRRKTATAFSALVTEAMQKLAMRGGTFDVVLDALENLTSNGLEQVDFRVSVHKGMAPQSLARIASGGELSRLSLAIQTVASRVARVPTLVFDEVDVGIGGRVAEIVGRMLKELGRKHQIMCITHLPQVAACADQQWQVTKTTSNSKVVSRVTVLDRQQRVEEIARMLGGVKITETTRRHAAEMLGGK